jgi:2-methylaconitate cis-trans-isomerase PrpF
MQKAHHAYAVTGAMCTAVAAALPGTVPAEFLETEAPDEVVLGHPKGTMTVGVDVDADGAEVAHTRVDRTARKVMDGDLYYLPRE